MTFDFGLEIFYFFGWVGVWWRVYLNVIAKSLEWNNSDLLFGLRLQLDSYEYSKYVNITQAQYNRDMVSVEFDIMRVSMVFHNTFREVLIMSNSTYSHAQLVHTFYRINVINAVDIAICLVTF